jgi:tRNA A-37 threonylcarbamoyl transferase component Bud32
MGAVYLGEHVKLGKRVAVKFLHARYATSPELVARFEREARAASLIEHSNIVNVMDVGTAETGEPYLVMEYLEGESLAEMLERKGPIDLAAACGVLEPVLLALAATHGQGIVHRDLKPDNIFLAHEKNKPPVVKIIDFGISKFLGDEESARLTQTGAPIGTPAYMAPEQVLGDRDIDSRADLYAVGVMAYEMLTARLPFEGHIANVLVGEPTPPNAALPEFPREAEPLVMKLLSRNPDDRPRSAESVLDDLRQLSGYGERGDRLTRASSGLTRRRFAGGRLGAAVTPERLGGPDSENAAASSGGARTPRGNESDMHRARFFKRALVLALVALGAVLAILLLVVWRLSFGEQETAPAPELAASPANPAASLSDVDEKGEGDNSEDGETRREEPGLTDAPSGAISKGDVAPMEKKTDTRPRVRKPQHENKFRHVF